MSTEQTKKLSWTPKRRGSIYCAPACGRGCTVKEHQEAKLRATKLKRFLEDSIGGKWRIRVWENLGWHSSVQQGTLSISISLHALGADSYMLMNSGDGNHVGSGHCSLTVHHPKNKKKLLSAIRASLKEHHKLVRANIDAYDNNRFINGFKPSWKL